MTTEPMRKGDSPPDTARGLGASWLLWVAGGILALIGAAATVHDSLGHHHDVGPYLLAAGVVLLLLAALERRRVERSRTRRATRTVRRLAARVERLEDNRHHLENDRDQWRRMQAEEASINRRLTERMQRSPRPRAAGGASGAAATRGPVPQVGAPGGYSRPTPTSPARAPRPRARHQVRRPADNQPALFDQDDERTS